MKKWLMGFPAMVLSAIVLFSGGSAFSQEDIKAVEDSAFVERIRPKVAFFHDDHNEKAGIDDCSKCHHVYDGTTLVEDDSSEDNECSACHVTEQGENVLGLSATYHLRCKGCHMENKKGPVTCSECHVKK